MEKRVNPHILTSEIQIERLCARENWVNPYEVLLLGPEASDEAIKAKFQKFSLILHPDRCRDERALQAFQIMESAYRTLQDPEKKSTYVRIMREARERIEFERKKENRRREMLGLAKLPEDTFDSEVRDMSNRIFREIDEKKFHFDKYDWLAKKRQRDEEDKRREEEERKNNEEKEWERSRDKRVNQWRKFTMKKDHKSVKNRMKTFEMKPPSTKPEERPSNNNMDKLKQIKLLGEGAFGKCYLCEHPDNGSKYVVKQIDISRMTPQEKKEAYHEAKVMSAFDHPNIIKFIDVYTTTNGKLNIVMNYADGGDLSSKISQQRGRLFSENEILDLFVQVLLAMKHVHDRKVLHRDIKGQNIFLMKSGLIKLGDFGISKVLSNTVEKARTMVGTPYYLSPEIVENRPYSFKSDIWSLGVLLYELCTLKPPFDGTSIRHLGLNIVRGIYPPPPPHYSRDLKMLIAQMLTVDSNRRPTVAQILRMPFIKSRIQNLLSESTRFEEFSHTILHKQGLFEAKKNENPRPDSKPDQKKVEVKNLLNQIMEEKKEIPKLEYKNFVNNEKKLEIKKELPKPEPKREPPKPEVRDFQVMQDKAPNPRFKVVEVKKMDEDKKPAEVKPNRYEIPKFQDIKKPEQPAYRPEPVRNEIPKNQDIKRPEPPAFRPEPVYKPVPPKAPIMQGRLEDVFKPVDKPQVKKPDPVRAQAQDELRKKKEQEARKKLEELMQKRENEKLEEVQRKEAAEKKRQEKMKKIQEERAKMMQDIKQKKYNKGESQVIVKPLEPLISNDPDPQPLSLETRKSDFNDTKSSKEKPKYAENRQKMLEALRQKKSNQPQENFVIEWVGIRNPEERRLYEVLQEAITETSSNDEDPIYITQIPNTEEEEIIDRIDEIADKEVVIVENQINPTETEDNEYDFDFNYNSLEAMRMLVEEKMGCELLFEAYKVMKNMGDIDPLEVGYTIFYEKLSGILPKSNLEEYVSYLRTLMIFENKAENP